MFVAEIIGKKTFQMLLVNRDHMIEQIAPAILDPALGDAILPVTLERRSYGSQAPVQTRACPVQADKCLRSDKNQGALPVDQSRCAITQKNLSKTFNLDLGCRRLKTASCCRRARFSGKGLRREQNKREIVPRQSRMMVNIVQI
jgi:hypothetical protein